MSDLTSAERLAKLRTLEAWLDWQLHDTRRKIAALEAEASPPVGYVVEKKIRDDHPLGADDARTAIAKDGRFFHACEFCKPGESLGISGDS